MSLALLPKLFEEEFFGGCTSTVALYENEEAFIVKAPLAGVKRENISVTLKEGMLTIEGSIEEEKNLKVHRKTAGRYAYQIALPQQIDEGAQIEASYVDGVLSIALPKAKAAKPLKITIK